jgi:hypothetical protein
MLPISDFSGVQSLIGRLFQYGGLRANASPFDTICLKRRLRSLLSSKECQMPYWYDFKIKTIWLTKSKPHVAKK